MAQSPASSPRLPSPPPMAEDQVGPTSPGALGLEDLDKIHHAAALDQAASRRIRPGTRAEAMHEGPPLVEFSSIDSAFQLTEHLKALFSHLTTSSDSSVPITRATALQLSIPPPGVDRGIWLYELCRLLVARANTILISLFADAPACSAATCPEMRASEWQYLCAAHDPPKSCCAIDYCCHTLDWSATQLTSSKLFPSRLALGTENVSSAQQLRKMTEIFRRVYRIFAHAWFQHRDVFWRVEGRTGLYVFFKTVCDEFRLIPEDSYTVPAEAEGGVEGEEGEEEELSREQLEEKRVLSREEEGEDDRSGKDTQKRHHRTMAERQNSVSTVIHEEVEEDDEDAEPEEPVGRGVVEEILPSQDGPVMPHTVGEEISPQDLAEETQAPDHLVVQKEVTVDAAPAEDEGESIVEPKTETTIIHNAEEVDSPTIPAATEEHTTPAEKEDVSHEEPLDSQASAVVEEEDATKTVAD